MFAKPHTQSLAIVLLVLLTAALLFGGDYFIRHLIGSINAKASAGELTALRERVAKLEAKSPTSLPPNLGFPSPFPTETTIQTGTSPRKPQFASSQPAEVSKEDEKDNGKFVLLKSETDTDPAAPKSEFKLLGHD